ncbi:39S ribosomal protein L41, mitochondrial [Leptopilina boulardi]|uniref:39S ribosomal protein L41, mitochondrial n=1 Tax=Leptopilina boulardi TaxID=63433 RepID=UPI0021F541B0|nr:39S ribosomal protein L41, mitochondrial [Leptopilina boulardi]XP_051164266.1 39S ribosomal protein L41, mitochondrial [Leptopilina boulardi]
MASACLIISRGISTSCANYGKRNFRKFLLYGKRGTKLQKQREAGPDRELPAHTRGVRSIGYESGKDFVVIPEMIPEIIVPDLKDCKLKPYVTYESEDVYQSEFTAQDLFNAVYSEKIVNDYNNKQLDPDGQSLKPSKEENLTAEEATINSLKTGSDIFQVDKEEVIGLYKKKVADSMQKAKELGKDWFN